MAVVAVIPMMLSDVRGRAARTGHSHAAVEIDPKIPVLAVAHWVPLSGWHVQHPRANVPIGSRHAPKYWLEPVAPEAQSKPSNRVNRRCHPAALRESQDKGDRRAVSQPLELANLVQRRIVVTDSSSNKHRFWER